MKRDYRNFEYTNENYLIFCTTETFSRTASGKSWKNKPDSIKNEIVTPEFYTNFITAIPFFNGFGNGAYCKATYTYNAPGYLPTTVITVSPYRETKKITRFEFINK